MDRTVMGAEDMAQTLTILGRVVVRWEGRKPHISAKRPRTYVPFACTLLGKCVQIERLHPDVLFVALELFIYFVQKSAIAWKKATPPDPEFVLLSCMTCLQLASKMVLLSKRMMPARTIAYANRYLQLRVTKKDLLDMEFCILSAIQFDQVPSPAFMLENFLEAALYNLHATLGSKMVQETVSRTAARILLMSYARDNALHSALSQLNQPLTLLLRVAGVIATTIFVIDPKLSNATNITIARDEPPTLPISTVTRTESSYWGKPLDISSGDCYTEVFHYQLYEQ
eukprot:gene9049-1367_t